MSSRRFRPPCRPDRADGRSPGDFVPGSRAVLLEKERSTMVNLFLSVHPSVEKSIQKRVSVSSEALILEKRHSSTRSASARLTRLKNEQTQKKESQPVQTPETNLNNKIILNLRQKQSQRMETTICDFTASLVLFNPSSPLWKSQPDPNLHPKSHPQSRPRDPVVPSQVR